MAVTTVAQFAAELNRPASTLLEQLQSAGVVKQSAEDVLTEGDKERLLTFLRSSHGTAAAERKKITLTRKSTSEIKQADASGRARTIQVEVRKKRVFVKRDEGAGMGEVPATPTVDEDELRRREEEASRQAELLRRQEEELAEKRRLREEKEQREAEEARARHEAAEREAAAAQAAAASKAADAAQEPTQPQVQPGEAADAPTASPAAPAPEAPAQPTARVVMAAEADAAERQR
ncbi:MAG: translation initiation factor IF-2 associated domain-containing protein, partial [Betaproteobacteria bacterium]